MRKFTDEEKEALMKKIYAKDEKKNRPKSDKKLTNGLIKIVQDTKKIALIGVTSMFLATICFIAGYIINSIFIYLSALFFVGFYTFLIRMVQETYKRGQIYSKNIMYLKSKNKNHI